MNEKQKHIWSDGMGRIELSISIDDASSCTHIGRCDDDVSYARRIDYLSEQLDALNKQDVCACLREYGAWDDEELGDHEQNIHRLLWIACGDISEGNCLCCERE